jgi:hypothetical protein
VEFWWKPHLRSPSASRSKKKSHRLTQKPPYLKSRPAAAEEPASCWLLKLKSPELLLLKSPELQSRLGKRYCNESELLPLLLSDGLFRQQKGDKRAPGAR